MPGKNWIPACAGTSGRLSLVALGVLLLAGCSEYLDRRDTIALSSGNAVASDQVTQMVDPWPPASANKDIAFNGDRMEAAYTRYRTGKVIVPSGIGTSASYNQPAPTNTPANTTPVGPTVTQAPAK